MPLFSRWGPVTSIIFIIPWLCLLPVLGMTSFREWGVGTQVGDDSWDPPPLWFPSAPPLLHAAVTSTLWLWFAPRPELTLSAWW